MTFEINIHRGPFGGAFWSIAFLRWSPDRLQYENLDFKFVGKNFKPFP